jgi:hypothetical protein
VSHHGGLGGPQNRAFIFHPAALPAPAEPVIWATGVYRVLRAWRDAAAAGSPDPSLSAAPVNPQ